ncbi:MAG: hypothetical protein HY360_21025 [Verrucomicrobia bacterium]|nr:hypothetical protein [Verrucomicrobiota bacterium]
MGIEPATMSAPPTIELANDWFRAAFDESTGALMTLHAPWLASPLIERSFVRYVCDNTAYVESPQSADARALEIVAVKPTADSVRSVLRGPQVEIERCFCCEPGSPLLNVALVIRGRAAATELREPRLPYVQFAEDFLSVIEGDEPFPRYRYKADNSEFFHRYPEFYDHSESGHVLDFRLSLAFEEVRRHKINILVEAAGYGLTGLSLGFLRHPPTLCYHPALAASYKKKYGVELPRDMTPDFFAHLNTLPESTPEHERWYRHRAEHLTRFGRELRAALAARGMGHVKVSIWVRPQHCLFDGIDLNAWLDEKLCDEVVAGPYAGDMKLLVPTPEWKQRVQSCVPLIGGINVISPAVETSAKAVKAECARLIREGYDGICTYECNDAVVMPEMIKLYHSLRRRLRGHG